MALQKRALLATATGVVAPFRPAATAARQCLVVTSGRLAQPRCHADA